MYLLSNNLKLNSYLFNNYIIGVESKNLVDHFYFIFVQ